MKPCGGFLFIAHTSQLTAHSSQLADSRAAHSPQADEAESKQMFSSGLFCRLIGDS
jgi:hypothetical protein